jgi:hypothetical protein
MTPVGTRGSRAGAAPRGYVVVCLLGLALSVLLGLAASRLMGVAVAVVTLLPILSHIRCVGPRRAITEPSIATLIVVFYTAVFPLRGLGIVLSGYTNIDLVLGTVSSAELVAELVLASLATTVLIEAFHWRARAGATSGVPRVVSFDDTRGRVRLAAEVLVALSLLALLVIFYQSGGISGAQAKYFSHSKADALEGAKSTALTIWSLLSVPAVWLAACYAVDPGAGRFRRRLLVSASFVIVLAHLIIFGSRLNALLALIGAWIVVYYSRKSMSAWKILIAIPLIVVISSTLLASRAGGEITGQTQYERYSKEIGYSVLDVSLAVRQKPGAIRDKLSDSRRWLDLPLYFAPSPLWPNKPNIDTTRLDLFVAQSLGNRYQQETGFPTSYITEAWLYWGTGGVLVLSLLLGAGFGGLHRRVLKEPLGAGGLIWYCLVATSAFSYYKDGDILTTSVGIARTIVYVALILLVFGLWSPFSAREERRRTAPKPLDRVGRAPA